jgi:phage gp36-like protein
MYLNLDDLKKGVRGETLNIVSREEGNALQAIREAMAEAESYLSARYAIAAELSKTPPEGDQPDDRVTMVVKLVRDIALYNCFNIANPLAMPENRTRGYDNALKFLRDCQAEKAAIPGLSRLNAGADGSVSSSYVLFGQTPSELKF